MNFATITRPGANIATSGSSASVAIPNGEGAQIPKYVRIAATAAAYVRLGASGLTAAAGDMLVQPGDSIVVRSIGFTHAAAVQVSAAGVVQISPVENQ